MPKVASWRQSSEPMDPAAPVTITVLPWKLDMISSIEIWISGRMSRSSISMFLRVWTGLPSTISSIGGAKSIFIPQPMAYLIMRSFSMRASSSVAKRMASAVCSSTTASNSCSQDT